MDPGLETVRLSVGDRPCQGALHRGAPFLGRAAGKGPHQRGDAHRSAVNRGVLSAMCGLVTLVIPEDRPVSTAVIRRLTESLKHRGPDDVAYLHVDPRTAEVTQWAPGPPDAQALSGVVFGFRRLSILDPSPHGRQPILSRDRALAMTFNGEIYNFVELAGELTQHGATFTSSGDTEVLLKAYERWGAACLPRLNGMWAFTLWDARRRSLVASRDRFGVKPLYYTRVDGVWIFASEIKALLLYPGAHRGFNEPRVLDYLREGRIDDGDETLFAGVMAVPPASFLELTGDQLHVTRFWRLDAQPDRADARPLDVVADFRELLTDAVRLRLRSDVPVGTMLSGGVDSTSIAALVHELKTGAALAPASAESRGLRSFHHAFSACWPGWAANEEVKIDGICARFDLKAQKLYPRPHDVMAVLEKVVYHLDQPFQTPIAAVNYMLMCAARDAGVKVVLNGHGADETLAGYAEIFVLYHLCDLLRGLHVTSFLAEHRAFRTRSRHSTIAMLRLLAGRLLPAIVRARRSRARRGGTGRDDLFAPPAVDDGQAGVPDARLGAAPSLLEESLRHRFFGHYIPQWMRMEDRMSMAASVESRLPFMDYRLVEFAFGLPAQMKLRHGRTKFILREAMKETLPHDIVFEEEKVKFAVPEMLWFRREWRPFIEQTLLTSPRRIDPFLNVSRFSRRLAAWLGGDDSAMTPHVVWRALNAELWMQRFGHAESVST